MMRLPRFRYVAPRSVGEAARVLSDAGPEGMLLAGGTDLLPNMKRRQHTPATVVGLRGVPALRERRGDAKGGFTLGAMTRLADVERDRALSAAWPALPHAASLVATPPIRNGATLGGNLCLDTRCSYYDQSEDWRAAIGFCMKKDGETCWVAPGSPRCWAVCSSDTAPVLCAVGAEVTVASAAGERRVPVAGLFADDGMAHLTLRRGEILTAVHVPAPRDGERASYLKVRRRGSFDFPVLGIAASAKLGAGGAVESARVFLGGVASRPQEAAEAAAFLAGRNLGDEEVVREAARLVAKVATPVQNTDLAAAWRKRVAAEYAARALRELAS
jgi:4-hydroxybenzoyl-CoA reductase subunit beta